jgi:hypothetical protein
MNILTSIRNHVVAPFTHTFPPESECYKKHLTTASVPLEFRILSIVVGLGTFALASRRYNVFGSAALGALTFSATSGMFKALEVSKTQKLCRSMDSQKTKKNGEVSNNATSPLNSEKWTPETAKAAFI